MSKANGATIKRGTYLQHASLKNYKSIKEVKIDFKPGLNIIIGKNASGKTNFVNGLNIVLNSDYDKFLDSESVIKVCFNEDNVEVRVRNKALTNEDFDKNKFHNDLINHDIILIINDKKIKIESYEELLEELFEPYFFNPVLIGYGIPYRNNPEFVNAPFSFTIVNNGKVSRELLIDSHSNRTVFLRHFLFRLYIDVFRLYRNNEKSLIAEDLKKNIITFSIHHFKKINSIIFIYSPIKEIRLNPDFNLIIDELNQKQTISNFYLEFLIDNNWLTFNLLSDGTRRLFYLISEISNYEYTSIKTEKEDLNTTIVEEPELGIHPHQLHQLMQFIKEQSREKQIILTTHSPQVLDILGPDELDRIIICHYDSQKGTQLTHLSDKEIKKAQKYMKEEAFLSDYWRFSDLEPAS